MQKQLPDLRRNPNIMAREHPESVKRLSVERGDLERAATLHALTLHARRTKPRGPQLFLHEPLGWHVPGVTMEALWGHPDVDRGSD